jgi:hypothetical protein
MNKSLSYAKALNKALFEIIKEQVAVNKNAEVLLLAHGIGIRLYNKNKRPTTYHASFSMRTNLFSLNYTVDTIVAENKEHEMLKRTVTCKEREIIELGANEHVARFLTRLGMQSCDGSREEMLENFTPLGLLYVKK